MEGLLLLLLFPLVWPFIAKRIWQSEINWQEMFLNIIIVVILTALVWQAGIYAKTSDTEIWNGQVLDKKQVSVPCQHSYQCNCREECSGSGKDRSCSTVCDTCYEHFNDYDWVVYSDAGDFTVARADRQGIREPSRWTKAQKGQPVARPHQYTNYIKAVPESLFHNESNIRERFKDMIPPYPDKVYDYQYLSRVLAVGFFLPGLEEWNTDLAMALRDLGPKRQANVIIVFVNTGDPEYARALEEAWLGGKKNDIVLVVGVIEYPRIEWVRVISWTDRQNFKVELRDAIFEPGNIDRGKILALVHDYIMSSFVRKPMKDFEYLKHEIDPPGWVIILAVIIAVGGSIGLSLYFRRVDADLFNR